MSLVESQEGLKLESLDGDGVHPVHRGVESQEGLKLERYLSSAHSNAERPK